MPLEISIDFKGHEPKVWVTCPSCKKRDWYYNLWIRRCNDCGFVIGSIYNIDKNIHKRMDFHKKGLDLLTEKG